MKPLRGVIRKPTVIGLIGVMTSKRSQVTQSVNSSINLDDQRWFGDEYDFPIVDITAINKPFSQDALLGEYGDLCCTGSGHHDFTHIAPGEDIPPVRCIRWIGEHAYVVGTGGQIYRRGDDLTWKRIDPQNKRYEELLFESVDGFSEDEIYIAGWSGVLVRWDGKRCTILDSPTDYYLSSLICAGNGRVYAAGSDGMLISGRDKRWRIHKGLGIMEDIWSIAWYRDRLWLATEYCLWTYQPGAAKAEAVTDFGDESPGTFRHLATGHGMLLSTAPDDVMLFDGTTWTRID